MTVTFLVELGVKGLGLENTKILPVLSISLTTFSGGGSFYMAR